MKQPTKKNTGEEFVAETVINERNQPGEQNFSATIYRDPVDVQTIFQLLSSLLILVALLALSALGNAWQYWRRPDRIVVDRSNGRVLVINDRTFGETDAVKMTPDLPQESDKKYLVREFVRSLYAINPTTRAVDIKTALEMMAPNSATKFAVYLKEQHILEQQRAESWQTVWTPQDVAIDRNDPFTVRVIGKQEITKMINNQIVQDTKQLQLTVKLVADPAGRTEQNKRMGFLVAAIDYKEISS